MIIDVVWFEKGANRIAGAFEVEKSTLIYSGILRLTDLHYSFPQNNASLYLIILDNHKSELITQLMQPEIKKNNIEIHYIIFSNWRKYCDALCTFGESKDTLKKLHTLFPPYSELQCFKVWKILQQMVSFFYFQSLRRINSKFIFMCVFEQTLLYKETLI